MSFAQPKGDKMASSKEYVSCFRYFDTCSIGIMKFQL